MSTTTYSDSAVTGTQPAEGKRHFWRRFADAFVAAQQRRAERDVARFIATHGGLFTDEMEREIMRKLNRTSTFGN
jgi:hypothetical protein